MKLFRSLSDLPAVNFDLEKYFLTAYPDQDILLFYINRPSVIVGRNKFIDAEVNISYCQTHGIEVIKRLSGGGTVYHDYGNINYSFIVGRNTEPVIDMDFATPVLAALASLNIHATVGVRKELLVADKKISGTASHVTRNRVLFHGTLLHNTNLVHLTNALKGNPALRRSHVASIPARIINLSEITGTDETTPQFLEKMLDYLKDYYQVEKILSTNGIEFAGGMR